MKIYMAGALFTAAERLWNRLVAEELRALGHEVFLPQESEQNTGTFDARAIWKSDVAGLMWSDALVVWLEGPGPDSGICWEHGYGKGKGKLVIGYTTDLRFQGAGNGPYDLNLMLTQGGHDMVRFHPDANPGLVANVVSERLALAAVNPPL